MTLSSTNIDAVPVAPQRRLLHRVYGLLRAGPDAGVRARAVSASAWTILATVWAHGLRLVSNLILTRLLFPEAFGLMAMVAILMQGLELFSDVGIGPGIVQSKRGDHPRFLRTAWTIQVIRGVLLWLAACAMAWPMAAIYREPILAQLIPVASLAALIAGFNSTRLFTAERYLAQARTTLLSMVGQIAMIVVMVTWAWIHPTVWALVGGGLVGAVVKMGLSHVVLPGCRDGWCWDAAARRELFHFGKWIFAATAVTFLAQQADRLILGRLLTMDLLGVYMIAFFLTDAPRQLVKRLGGAVLFPAIARKADLPRAELREKLVSTRWKPLLVLAGGIATMVAVGDWFILWLWDPRYAAASWMAPVLAVGLWPMALYCSLGPALLALGKPSYNALGNAGRFAFVLLAIFPAYQLAWVPGVLVVLALADLPNYVSVLLGVRREGLLTLRQDAAATAVFAALLLAMLALRVVLGFGLPFDPDY